MEQPNFLLKLIGNVQKAKEASKPPAPKKDMKQQRAIREGIKLRKIYQSVRMNDNSLMSHSFDYRKLIIQRNLGFKRLIPGAGQWHVCTDQKAECWVCNQSVLTLFLWKPRVGQLCGIKDKKTVSYYQDAVKDI